MGQKEGGPERRANQPVLLGVSEALHPDTRFGRVEHDGANAFELGRVDVDSHRGIGTEVPQTHP